MAGSATVGASLLGLPLELRRQIYSIVCTIDPNWTAVKLWHDVHLLRHGFQCMAELGSRSRSDVPWASLAKSCTAIRSELRDMMNADHKKKSVSELNTYILDLHLEEGARVIWRALPCDPSNARNLVANIVFRQNYEQRFWGNGGPRAVVRQIYQTLNHLIHCGPRLDDGKPLQHPMHLSEVTVRMSGYVEEGESAEDTSDPQYRRRYSRKLEDGKSSRGNVFDNIGSFIVQVISTGIASGCVDHFTILDDERGLSLRHEVVFSEDAAVPKEWDRYGLEWGVHHIDLDDEYDHQ